MRIVTICMAVMLGLFFAVFGLAAPPNVPADDYLMDKTKQPVIFPHTPHNKIECATCHHETEEAGKADFRPCADSGCHDIFDRRDKTEKSYYNVMHGRNLKFESCVSCHTKVAGNDREKRRKLTACKNSGCHQGAAGADGDEEAS